MQSGVTPLKLIALDKDDLEVISAHLQDAILKAGDIRWRPLERRLVIGLNRFDWEAAHGAAPEFRRCSAALRFERVLNCKALKLGKSDRNAVLNLLSVSFEERNPPSGVVTLTFSGGGALRLEVECLEAEVADLGAVWATSCCPDHSEPELKQA